MKPTQQWSTVVKDSARKDRGDIRRCYDPSLHPELGVDGCRTLHEGFRLGAELNPLGPCLGFRAVSSNGFATPFIHASYTECLARIDAFAAGLDELELVAPNEDDGMIVVSDLMGPLLVVLVALPVHPRYTPIHVYISWQVS